jgi:hypothetical protein
MLLLDVGVQFLTCGNFKHTTFVTVSINPSTSIDLILGRHTLKKFDLFSLTPRALGTPQRQSSRPIIVAPPPTPPGATLPEAHRRHPGSALKFCSRHNSTGVSHQPCSMCEVHQPSCSVTAAVDRCGGDHPRHGIDPPRTTSHMPSRKVGALLDTAAEVPSGIILSVEEIDDDRLRSLLPPCNADQLFPSTLLLPF